MHYGIMRRDTLNCRYMDCIVFFFVLVNISKGIFDLCIIIIIINREEDGV